MVLTLEHRWSQPGDAGRYAVMTAPLPKSLNYMEPFLELLESLPPDAVNEDVDSQLLDDGLRTRLATGDPHKILEADFATLENWLASFDSSQHPAHWIVGYLGYVQPEDIDSSFSPAAEESLAPEVEQLVGRIESLANEMLDRAASASDPPVPLIDGPTGWKLNAAPGISELKHGRSQCTITIINKQFFDLMHQQHSATSDSTSPVTFGINSGFKYRYASSDMPSVSDYLLQVAGGYVRIRLSLADSLQDEQQFEACLSTLRVAENTA